jgi:hypothetical protein
MIESARFSQDKPDEFLYLLNKKFKRLLDEGNREEASKLNEEIKCLEIAQCNVRLLEMVKSLEMERTILSKRILVLTNQVEDLKDRD